MSFLDDAFDDPKAWSDQARSALVADLHQTMTGDFNATWVIPAGVAAVAGGLLGGKLSLKTRPENLRKIFTYTMLTAALFMIINAWL